MLSDYRNEPHKYEQWKGGVYWSSSSSIECFTDVIMHLLFLGIVKASKELLSKWITESKEYKNITYAQNICSRLYQILDLTGVKS